MSFFGDMWGGVKKGLGYVGNAATNVLSRFAPAVGGMLGQRFGGNTGQQLGSSLGNMVQGLTGGNPHSLATGMGGMGQMMGGAGGQGAVNAMPSWMQNSTLGRLGANAGAQGGAHAGQWLGSMLPKEMQGLAPSLQHIGSSLGQGAGGYLQKHFGPKVSPQMNSTTMAQMPSYLGGRAGAKAYNRTDIGKQQAADNMSHFAELPGMAGGGYMDPTMGNGGFNGGFSNHHMMHTMPYGGGHGPVMFHNGGYADGGDAHHYAMGGYADPYAPQTPQIPQMQQQPMPQQFAHGGYAGGGYAGGGAPISLHELVEMLPYTGGH